jgi:hypothetical protein
MHGLHANRQAEIEQTEDKIIVRYGEKQLSLTRNFAILTLTRDNGEMGTLEFTEAGTLRSSAGEEAMDLAAEEWGRYLMQEHAR